jgi:hypothetical protein
LAEWNPYARRTISLTFVECFRSGVAELEPSGGEDPVAVLADRASESHERFEATARQAGQEPVDQLGDGVLGQVGGEDRADHLLHRPGAGDLAAGGVQRGERVGLALRRENTLVTRMGDDLQGFGTVRSREAANLRSEPVRVAHIPLDTPQAAQNSPLRPETRNPGRSTPRSHLRSSTEPLN